MIKRLRALAGRVAARRRCRLQYQLVAVTELPERLRRRTVYVVGEGGHVWEAAMACPRNACSRRLRMNLVPEARPRWQLIVGDDGTPSIAPSIWRRGDCGCHFWLRAGRIQWCQPESHERVGRTYLAGLVAKLQRTIRRRSFARTS